MLSQYDYSIEEWVSILKQNLQAKQTICVKMGISPYNEWIVFEKDVELQGYSEKMVLCRPKSKVLNKNSERYFSYTDIIMVF